MKRAAAIALLLAAAPAFADDATLPATVPDAPAATPPTNPEAPKQPAPKKAAAIEPITTSNTVGVTKHEDAPGLETGGVKFELHGYARMPLSANSTPREPYLVDNDYYL